MLIYPFPSLDNYTLPVICIFIQCTPPHHSPSSSPSPFYSSFRGLNLLFKRTDLIHTILTNGSTCETYKPIAI